MRIIQSDTPRPLNRLALGPGGLVAAASATFGAPGDVEVWDAASGTRRLVHRVPGLAAAALAFTSDGRRIVLARSGEIAVLDATTGTPVRSRDFGPVAPKFALSPDATRLFVTVPMDRYSHVQYLDGETLQTLWSDGQSSMQDFDSPAVSPDAARVAVTERAISFARATLMIRDAADGRVLVTIPIDAASPIHQLAFTADGAKLLARTESRAVQLYDAATGAPAGELVHAGRPFVTGIAVHPRGPVACCRTNGTVSLWDVEKRELLRTFEWLPHTGKSDSRFVSVGFSPDGALAAAGTEDGKLVIWDVDL